MWRVMLCDRFGTPVEVPRHSHNPPGKSWSAIACVSYQYVETIRRAFVACHYAWSAEAQKKGLVLLDGRSALETQALLGAAIVWLRSPTEVTRDAHCEPEAVAVALQPLLDWARTHPSAVWSVT